MTETTYKSTRGKSSGLTFEQALLSGYAEDGGLFLPDKLPSTTLLILSLFSFNLSSIG